MKKKIIVFVSVLLLAALALDFVFSNFIVTAKKYTVKTGNISDVKLVFMSDIHIGAERVSLDGIVRTVEKSKPDIICLAGDIISENTDEAKEKFFDFLDSLTLIAPVYFSYGNHEKDLIKNGYTTLPTEIISHNINILDDTFVDLTVNGSSFRLGGMLDEVYHFYYTPETFSSSPRASFLKDFNNTSLYKIMLCHRSDSYTNYNNYGVEVADLMLAGHTHGGLVRVPFGKGVYIPDMGWFSELSYGDTKKDGTEIIVTSGTAGEKRYFRFNNPCEVAEVTFDK